MKGKRLTLLAAGVLLVVAGILIALNWDKLAAHYQFWRGYWRSESDRIDTKVLV